ncbi:archease [bacterium]|nr:archease [bacterium]
MSSDFKPFIFEEHSGDLRIKAFGRDEMEALANASSALLSQIVDLDKIEQRELRNIVIEDSDKDTCFIAFLNELVYLVDAQKWLPAGIKRLTTCARSGCDRIEAVLAGQPFNPLKHPIRCNVKAVTYHDFSISRESNLVVIRFVCDL